MKASLKSLMKPAPVEDVTSEAEPIPAEAVEPDAVNDDAPPPQKKPPRPAQTRIDTRQLSGHFPALDVQAFRVLAAEQDMDVQELLAEAMNMIFQRYGRPNRIPVTSGRRKRSA